jgi:type III pantothenate kinase
MILLLDIGNTHTHLGLANGRTVVRRGEFPTQAWHDDSAISRLGRFVGRTRLQGVPACSVVPHATAVAMGSIESVWPIPWFQLTHRTARAGVGFRYPKPRTIGPDRLANVIAARHHYGAPCLALDFGTAVTFDVVDKKGCFVGGAIAPGISLMTSYLHEKTALLPEIELGAVRRAIGRSTVEAMRIAAVHGFRGLVTELIRQIKRSLGCRKMPVVATGAYARWIVRGLPEITAVEPNLTLEGLRLAWKLHLES